MGHLKLALLIPIFTFSIVSGALAGPIISVGGEGGWQTWSSPSEDGSRFWDNPSWDGYQMNIGYYILDPAFGGGNLSYWGTSNPGYDSSFYFHNESGTQYSVLWGGTTSYQGTDEFGWFEYMPAAPGQPGVIGDRHALFGGSLSAAPGTTAIFTPTDFYGYYLTSGNGETYTTLQDGRQFALFNSANGALWFGVEDLPVGGYSDGDYNDMIVSSIPVPEPSTLLLLGTGLTGLAAAARRRLRR